MGEKCGTCDEHSGVVLVMKAGGILAITLLTWLLTTVAATRAELSEYKLDSAAICANVDVKDVELQGSINVITSKVDVLAEDMAELKESTDELKDTIVAIRDSLISNHLMVKHDENGSPLIILAKGN